jgi:hypothetical protein
VATLGYRTDLAVQFVQQGGRNRVNGSKGKDYIKRRKGKLEILKNQTIYNK